ncbi:MAG: hypothetical protein ACR2P1_11570 [Pseudomonadales bacterium]
MSTCIIELNDIGLFTTVAAGLYAESPGYALLNGAEVVVGKYAQAAARLHPRQINNRFWQQLGMNPLAEQSHLARHHADLAYLHLQHIHQLASEPEQVIFAVPASFDREQLAVLLGITQQCPFDAVGLVDLAVAAAAGVDVAGSGVHIDMQLHQAVVTSFSASDGSVAREATRIVEGGGMLALFNQFSHLIADAFIQQCRFDPLHDAQSEQLLYDALPEWLQQAPEVQEFVFEIPQANTVHKAKLPRDSFLEPVRQLQQRIQTRADELTDAIQCTLVTQRLFNLPGFFELVANGIAVPQGAVADACWNHADIISSDDASLPFITRLPATLVRQTNEPADLQASAQSMSTATHIVVDNTAYALGEEALYLHANGDGCLAVAANRDAQVQACLLKKPKQVWLDVEPGATVIVNDIAVQQKQSLAKGDRLSLAHGGPQALLIEVHGTQT